jgi:hypothetical protein
MSQNGNTIYPDNGTAANFESILLNNLKGNNLVITPTLYAWQETRTMYGYSNPFAANGSFPALLLAYQDWSNNVNLVKVGTIRPNPIGDAVVVRVDMVPSSGETDTVGIDQNISMMMPGPNAEVAFDTYQQTEVRTFAEDPTGWPGGNSQPDSHVTAISYIQSGPLGVQQAAGTNTNVPIVAQIPVPSVIRSIRVTQYEILTGDDASPRVISDAERPMWNSDPIWGYDVGQILFLGVSSTSDGSPLYRRTYTFLLNQYGWHHFYAIYKQADGFTPWAITPINPATVDPMKGTYSSVAQGALSGIRPPAGNLTGFGVGGAVGAGVAAATTQYNGTAAFRMLPNVPFAEYFSHLKPPFKPTAVSSAPVDTSTLDNANWYRGDPANRSDSVGDFFAQPGNFA